MKRLLLPSVMATLASVIVMELISFGPWSIVASTSVASTAFVLFASPNTLAARPWNTLVGHTMGLAAGLAVYPLTQYPEIHQAVAYAGSVGFSVFFMQLARAKHPPAASTALTVPTAQYLHGGFEAHMALVVMLTVVGLLLAQLPVRRHLDTGD